MKAKSITYRRLANLGNFEHESLEICVELEDDETAGEALNRAKNFVTLGLKKRPREDEIASAKNIMANPDAYTGYQVKEAEKIMALVNVPYEIPF